MSGLGAFLGRAGSAASSSGLSALLGPIGGFIGQSVSKNFPIETWSPGDLINALAQNQIRHEWFQEQMLRQGFDVSQVYPVNLSEVTLNNGVLDWDSRLAFGYSLETGLIRSMLASPNLEQINTLWNRRQITRKLADRWVQKQGFYDVRTRDQILSLANEIPDASELIDYGQSGLFYPDFVIRYGLQNYFPETLRKWIHAHGLDWPLDIAKPPGIGIDGNPQPAAAATWADLKWWNHWRQPGLGDVYTMYQRLYLRSPFGPSPLVASAGTVNEQDVKFVQSTQSIPEFWRDPAIAVSFTPFNKREIQRLYNYEVVSDAEVYHTMRFNGYSDVDAQAQLRLAKLLKREFDRKQKYKLSASQVCNLYQTGVLDNEAATEKLFELEYDTGEASAILANCDLEWQKKLVDKSLRYIKDAFLYGIINKDQLLLEFVKLGIARTRMDQYIQLWELQRDSRFKEVRASEILKWAELGIITTDEAFSRLVTMGYPALDAQKMLIVVAVKLAEQQTKAFAAQTKAAERQLLNAQKAKEKEAKILATQEKNRIKALLVASTQANLKTWIKDGLITDQEATDRLMLKGWPNADIERFLEEAHKPPKAKGTSNATKTKKGKQTASGGSSSNPPTVP